MGISIIIPTFDNIEYIDKTLNSIYRSGKDLDYEILIGIDGCEKSLNYLKNKSYPSNTKIYYFSVNKGPYLIKNTLSTLAKYDNLLFFDSDDIMEKNMIGYCLKSLNKYQCVKPRLRNFRIIDGIMVGDEKRKNWGEGVFAIHKKIFDYYNGFEGWLVAADSDFMNRLYKNKISVELTQEILVLRRLHDKGLTSRPDTGLRSELRSKYASISKSKKYFGPLPIMRVSKYVSIENAVYVEYNNDDYIEQENIIYPKQENIEDVNEFINNINERKKLVKETIEFINNKTPKVISNPVEKKPVVIDYEKVNKLLKNRVIPNPTPKVKKVDDSIKNKNTMSNREMVKTMFPGKPNRRNDDQTMTFGKK
jgi:glycosyltransferase involved in cell wall biosynthesis